MDKHAIYDCETLYRTFFCATCGTAQKHIYCYSLHAYRLVYACMECGAEAQPSSVLGNEDEQKTKACLVCGETFLVQARTAARKKYCSPICKEAAHRRRDRERTHISK